MNSFLADFQYALRTLFQRPVFSAAAIGSIALGISVNATVFSWVDHILLQPLSGVPDSHQIAAVKTVAANGDLLDSSYPDYRDFRDHAKSLAGAIAFQLRPLYLGDAPRQQRVWSEMVSGNFFDVLGVKPILGRTFSPEEQADRPGAAPVAVISETLWRGRFHSDPQIVGSKIRLNRQVFTIIGVAPADFAGTFVGLKFDIFAPLTMLPQLTGSPNWLEYRDERPLALMARLRPDVGIQQAASEMRSLAAVLAKDYPETNRNLSASVLPIADSPDGVQKVLGSLLRILLAIAAGVLLIVCANVGNLLLARATSRQREFGIRMSLGAGRMRIARQLLTESLVLAVAGAALGVLAASWMGGAINAFVPATNLPVTNLSTQLGKLALGFTCVLCFLTTILCGLAPLAQLFRRDVQEGLREGGRGISSGGRLRRLRAALVIAEMTLALVALIGSGLFLKSFQKAKSADPGFDPQHVMLAGVELSQSEYSSREGAAVLRRLRDHLETVPGLRSVALAEDVPLGFSAGSWETVSVPNYAPQAGENMKLWRNLVSPGYFGTLKIPLLAGRDFNERDDAESAQVGIVNQTFVRRFFGGANAIGRKFNAFGRDITIVGIAKDSKYHELSEAPIPYFYVPLAQHYARPIGVGVIARTVANPEAFAQALQSQIRSVDPNIAISATATFTDFMSASYFAQKLGALLLTVLASLSLLLAMLGLYGVIAYSISERTHEIGIRIAVGAEPSQVLKLVIGEGMLLCFAGVAVGVLAALALSRLASSALYGIRSNDPGIFVAATALLLAFALFASWLPARRAARIDPIDALRWE